MIFPLFTLFFSLKRTFLYENVNFDMFYSKMTKSHQNIKRFILIKYSISQWVHHIPAIILNDGM